MKIGFFTDTYFPQISGVATSIKTLKEELEQKGHEVIIFTTSDPKAGEEEGIVRMPSIPFISFKDRRVVVSGMIDAYEQAKNHDLDIIHTHTEFGTGWLGKYIAKQLGIPTVHTYHTMYEDYLHYIAHGKLIRPYHVKQASRAFCRNLSGIVCPSERVVDKLRQYQIHAPMAIIPTGVNLSKFEGDPEEYSLNIRQEHGLSEENVLLLSLSRLSFEKNIQAIIQGMPAILLAVPLAKLLVVGKGPYLGDLQQLAVDLGVNKSVIFLGEVPNDQVGRYYREVDYFVNASDSESQGLTYIEALASSTKIVAKANDYLDQLLVDPALGQTFAEDNQFSATFISYYNQEIVDQPNIRAGKLFEISSQNFGNKIEQFYKEAQSYYEVFIEEEDDERTPLPLRLFKKKE